MDDRNFGKDDADDWINTIESPLSSVRDQDIYPILRDWIKDVRPIRVLDIGCGQGICSCKLASKDIEHIGIDPSPALIQRAKELYEQDGCKFILGNAYSLPLPDSSIDAAFSVAVWHLLENLEKASQELSRVLKSGGSFLLITADPDAYSSWTERYQQKISVGKCFKGTNTLTNGMKLTDVLYLHERQEIFNHLEASGLKIFKTSNFRNQILISGKKI